MTSCRAIQQGDQMACGRCGLQWDVGDPERPSCAPRADRRAFPGSRISLMVRRQEEAVPFVQPRPVNLPLKLPGSWAADMADAYEQAIDNKLGLREAMQEAYQVLRREMLR